MIRQRVDVSSVFIVASAASLGLLLGGLGAVEVDSAPRFTAQASVAMLPGAQVKKESISNYWEVLNRGQATRTAAEVIGEPRWLGQAAPTRDAAAKDLELSAGAVPDTTLILVEVRASSATAATQALRRVLKAALPKAAPVSGPFALKVVSGLSQQPVSDNPGRPQLIGGLGVAGALLGGGIGLLLARLRGRRRRAVDETDPVTDVRSLTESDSNSGRVRA